VIYRYLHRIERSSTWHNNATKFVEDVQSIPTLVASQLQDNYLRFVPLTEDLCAYESDKGWEEEDIDIY